VAAGQRAYDDHREVALMLLDDAGATAGIGVLVLIAL